MIYFSLVTVCYNSERTISRTINSVFEAARSFDGSVEYLIIDGKSSDSTVEIVESFKEFAPSNVVLSVFSEPDSGIYDAMNKGIMMAKGEWIGLLNSDDCYLPEYFSCISANINLHPTVELFHGDVFWRYSFLDSSDVIVRRNGTNDYSTIVDGMVINHPTVFCKKTVYQKYGLYDSTQRYVSDWLWMAKLVDNKITMHYIDSPLVIFDMSGVSNQVILRRYVEIFRGYALMHDLEMLNFGRYINNLFCLGLEMLVSVLIQLLPANLRLSFRRNRLLAKIKDDI